MYTVIRVCIYVHARTHTRTHTYIDTHRLIYTYVHTHADTHTQHTLMYTLKAGPHPQPVRGTLPPPPPSSSAPVHSPPASEGEKREEREGGRERVCVCVLCANFHTYTEGESFLPAFSLSHPTPSSLPPSALSMIHHPLISYRFQER
jgi:hypothetical protein